MFFIDNKELTLNSSKLLSLQFNVNVDVFETDARFKSEMGDCMQRTIRNLNGKGFTEDVIAIVDYMQSGMYFDLQFKNRHQIPAF